MKKFAKYILIIIVGVFFIFLFGKNNRKINVLEKKEPIKPVTVIPTKALPRNKINTNKSLFIPSWSDFDTISRDELSQYDRILFFGDATDGAFQKFLSIQHSNKYIVLKINKLENVDDSIRENVRVAYENKLQGIALDPEISGIPSVDTIIKLNSIVQLMYTETKKYYMRFTVIVYGDVFYRKRPYDIAEIAKNSDEIMIMAYDFHKAGGEPGPNFPLSNGAIYDYDLKMMTADYLKVVPQEKLSVIFGMYGYDWTVDDNQLPIKPAKALTLNQIHSRILNECKEKACMSKRDKDSGEMRISYDDENDDHHIVWFEDMDSVKNKADYLQENGIDSFAYWAEGYF